MVAHTEGYGSCGSLNENGSHRLMYLNAWLPEWHCLRRIRMVRRCGLVGGIMSLEGDFGV